MSDSLPPLPKGYALDAAPAPAASLPPLPDGYALDTAAPAATSDYTMGDVANAAVRGVPIAGGIYENNQSPEDQARAQNFDAAHPYISGAAKFGGGTLATGAALAALPEAATAALGLGGGALLPNVIRGAASNAALGSADAAVRGQDPVTGAEFGAAGGALGPVAGRVAGKVVDALTAPKVNTPSLADLDAASGNGFDAVRADPSKIDPNSVSTLASQIQSDLNSSGIKQGIFAPETHKVLDYMQDQTRAPALTKEEEEQGAPQRPAAPVTPADIMIYREMLGKAAGSMDARDAGAAVGAKNALDDWFSNIPAQDVLSGDPTAVAATYRDALGNYTGLRTAQAFDFRGQKAANAADAANSGMNLENNLRQQVKQVLNNPKAQRGIDPDTMAALRAFNSGSRAENVTRFVSNLFGGGGGVGSLAAGAVGHAIGGPFGAVLAPAVGFGTKVIANARAKSAFDALGDRIRQATPLGRSLPQARPMLTTQQRAALIKQLANAARQGVSSP